MKFSQSRGKAVKDQDWKLTEKCSFILSPNVAFSFTFSLSVQSRLHSIIKKNSQLKKLILLFQLKWLDTVMLTTVLKFFKVQSYATYVASSSMHFPKNI